MKLFNVAFLIFACFTGSFAEDAYRTIAILENERKLEAEPNIKLVDFFHASSGAIRHRALLAAARIGNPAVIDSLKGLSKDRDPEIRKWTAFALGQIRSKDGLDLASLLLKDEDPSVRRMAIEAVGRIGGLESTVFILPFFSEQSAVLREQAALALALIKDKSTVPLLIQRAEQKDPAQWSYVYALYRLADERSVPVLHQVLANPSESPSTGDPSSLLFALKALWIMKKQLNQQEIDSLLQHADPRVQQNALDALGNAGDKQVCSSIQKHYVKMNAISKGKAIEVMGNLGCDVPRPDTEDLFGYWLIAQAKRNKEKSVDLLQEGSKHASWTVRWRAAQALAELQASSATPLLKTLLRDSDSAVRLAALDSLSRFMPESADVFLGLLNDKDFAVRATAVETLGKTKDPKYLLELLRTWDVSENPSEVEGRVALLDALPEFNTSEALAVYERALLDPSFTIRRHAIDGLKKLVGSRYLWKGQYHDPETFLHLSGKVKRETMSEYPPDYGKTKESREVVVKLEKGDVRIRLFFDHAPNHAENFLQLAQNGFYDGLRIHRVVPNFVIQGGDPRGDGWGSAGKVLPDQINELVYKRGMVGMPIAGKDTGGSQFFITQSRQPHLDGNYTIFGEVVSGMDVVDRTQVGDKIISVK